MLEQRQLTLTLFLPHAGFRTSSLLCLKVSRFHGHIPSPAVFLMELNLGPLLIRALDVSIAHRQRLHLSVRHEIFPALIWGHMALSSHLCTFISYPEFPSLSHLVAPPQCPQYLLQTPL